MPYRLEARVFLPAEIEKVFGYFADPRNLETLTPPFLKFRIVTPDVVMARGAVIDYRLRLHGLPFSWQSEITVWEPGARFKDEQRRGPYTYWRHLHIFRSERGGTEVEDGVDYDVPGGRLIHRWLVGPDLIRIFRFRLEKLQEVFGGSVQTGGKISIHRKE